MSLIHEKNKNNIEKHGFKTFPEWITTTREYIHILEDSIQSLTSKTVPEDLSIVIQDVVSVKDVGGIDKLENLSDVVIVEEAVTGMKQLELALVVKEKEGKKNSVDDKIIGVKEKFEKEANEIPVDNEEIVPKKLNDKNSFTVVSVIEALAVKEKEELKNINKLAAVTESDFNIERNNVSVDDKIVGVNEKVEKEANEIPVDNEEKVQKQLKNKNSSTVVLDIEALSVKEKEELRNINKLAAAHLNVVSVDEKICENNENDEEVFVEEEGKFDVENIDNDIVEEKHELFLDYVPENTELKTMFSNINELTQKCKDNNTILLKDSVLNDSHESDQEKTICSKKKKKINVKFEIRCGSYVSTCNAIAANGNNDYFRNVINVKDHVSTTNPLYTHERQHVFHNDKELFQNCVLDEFF